MSADGQTPNQPKARQQKAGQQKAGKQKAGEQEIGKQDTGKRDASKRKESPAMGRDDEDTPPRKGLGKRISLLALGLFLVAVLLGYGGYRLSSGVDEGARLHAQGNAVGGSFRVFSLGGGMVTEGDFRGAWMIVWFVDPRCPPARCQPPLKALDRSLMTLKQQGRHALPLVVSLDVKAEDSDGLKEYVMGAAPHIFPVFATPNMTRAMTRLYHAPFRQEPGQAYRVPAPSFVVMDPAGHYAGMLPVTGDAATLTAGLEELMSRKTGK